MTVDQHINGNIAKHIGALCKKISNVEGVIDDCNKRFTAGEQGATKLQKSHGETPQHRHQQQKQLPPGTVCKMVCVLNEAAFVLIFYQD